MTENVQRMFFFIVSKFDTPECLGAPGDSGGTDRPPGHDGRKEERTHGGRYASRRHATVSSTLLPPSLYICSFSFLEKNNFN